MISLIRRSHVAQLIHVASWLAGLLACLLADSGIGGAVWSVCLFVWLVGLHDTINDDDDAYCLLIYRGSERLGKLLVGHINRRTCGGEASAPWR
jgi:hypothetical protein